MPHRLISFESISDVDVEPRKSYQPRERAPSSPNGQVRIDLWPSRIERDKAEEGGGITKGDESRLQGAKAVHFTEDTTGHRKTVLQMAVGDNDLSFEDVMMKEVKKSAKDSMSRPMTVIQLKNKAKEKAPSQAGVLSRLKERFARSASANASFMHEQCNYASIQEQCSYVDPDPSDSEEEEEEEMEGREGGAVRGTLRHGRKIPRALLDSSGSGSQSFFTPVSSVQEDLKKLLVNRKLGTARRAYLSCPGTAEEYLTDSDSMADAIPEDKTPNQVELENAPTESLPLYQVADACLLTGLKKPGRTSRFTSRQRGCGSSSFTSSPRPVSVWGGAGSPLADINLATLNPEREPVSGVFSSSSRSFGSNFCSKVDVPLWGEASCSTMDSPGAPSPLLRRKERESPSAHPSTPRRNLENARALSSMPVENMQRWQKEISSCSESGRGPAKPSHLNSEQSMGQPFNAPCNPPNLSGSAPASPLGVTGSPTTQPGTSPRHHWPMSHHRRSNQGRSSLSFEDGSPVRGGVATPRPPAPPPGTPSRRPYLARRHSQECYICPHTTTHIQAGHLGDPLAYLATPGL